MGVTMMVVVAVAMMVIMAVMVRMVMMVMVGMSVSIGAAFRRKRLDHQFGLCTETM